MTTKNYTHKFTDEEWQIIALAGECHLYAEKNIKEVEPKNETKKRTKKH